MATIITIDGDNKTYTQAHMCVCVCVFTLPFSTQEVVAPATVPQHMTLTWNMAAPGSPPSESLKGWLYCSHILCGRERDGQASYSSSWPQPARTHRGSRVTRIVPISCSLCTQRIGSEVKANTSGASIGNVVRHFDQTVSGRGLKVEDLTLATATPQCGWIVVN